jgi:hypothetical protein
MGESVIGESASRRGSLLSSGSKGDWFAAVTRLIAGRFHVGSHGGVIRTEIACRISAEEIGRRRSVTWSAAQVLRLKER